MVYFCGQLRRRSALLLFLCSIRQMQLRLQSSPGGRRRAEDLLKALEPLSHLQTTARQKKRNQFRKETKQVTLLRFSGIGPEVKECRTAQRRRWWRVASLSWRSRPDSKAWRRGTTGAMALMAVMAAAASRRRQASSQDRPWKP